MEYFHNPDRKSVGMVFIDQLRVSWTKWKYDPKTRKSEDKPTDVIYETKEQFEADKLKYSCTEEEYTHHWGRYGDASFPKLID